MTESKSNFNMNILIAVDDSENSRRAVNYAARMLARVQGCKVSLLHIIPEPEEDFFPDLRDRNRWVERYQKKMTAVLETYRKKIIDCGIPAEDVQVRLKLKVCPSLAECILKEGEKLDFDTIVIGRQGLSRREEFLFGSISSKIVTHARNCTVWVVE
jgi:nucleotide-binding universal stress UspA family protein